MKKYRLIIFLILCIVFVVIILNRKEVFYFVEGEEHKVLEANVAVAPVSVYDNSILCDYLKDELEDAKEMQSVYNSLFIAEYFKYDFNNDSLEDYLISLAGSGWSGSLGNHVSIVCPNEDGSLTEVFSATIRFAENGDEGGYSAVIVLDEIKDSFYGLVFEGYDKIWTYDSITGRYN